MGHTGHAGHYSGGMTPRDFFRLCTWMEKNRSLLQGHTAANVANNARSELVFHVKEDAVRAAAAPAQVTLHDPALLEPDQLRDCIDAVDSRLERIRQAHGQELQGLRARIGMIETNQPKELCKTLDVIKSIVRRLLTQHKPVITNEECDVLAT